MHPDAFFNSRPRPPADPCVFLSSDLERIFNSTFEAWGCRLHGGATEPLYTPGRDAGELDVIRYTRDYFGSALHEVAHWCIAGAERRRVVDYGYWYAPDGRTAAQQQAFERVEVKPQALEWLFNLCCGHRFRISADNLEAGRGASATFVAAVTTQARAYVGALHRCESGAALPERGRRFALALCDSYGWDLPREQDVELQ